MALGESWTNKNDELYISYIRSDKHDYHCLFPEEAADIQLTSLDQIIVRNIEIAYPLAYSY